MLGVWAQPETGRGGAVKPAQKTNNLGSSGATGVARPSIQLRELHALPLPGHSHMPAAQPGRPHNFLYGKGLPPDLRALAQRAMVVNDSSYVYIFIPPVPQ